MSIYSCAAPRRAATGSCSLVRGWVLHGGPARGWWTAWTRVWDSDAGPAYLKCPDQRERAMHELVIRPDWAQQIGQLRERLTEDTNIIGGVRISVCEAVG